MLEKNIDSCHELCKYAKQLSNVILPENVIECAKMFVADYFAASIAGYRINSDFNKVILKLIMDHGGSEQSSILFSDKKYPVTQAAFMNAIYAHGADMDDGNKKSAGHIGTHVIPSVFALAEYRGCSWGDVIVSIVIGYDFFNRIAGAAQPSLYTKGFHSTGVAGSIACAAACAKLLNMNSKGIYNSIGIAALQSSGLIIIDESAQHCKPINPANAARTGILSALIAEKGVEGPINPLESTKGWFHAYSDEINKDILLNNLGLNFTIEESYIKQYPSCRHTHCCIDAIKDIRESLTKRCFTYQDIESINVFIYPNAIKSAGRIIYPKNSGEAKFSIHYAIAKTLLNGNFSLSDLTPEYCPSLSSIIGKINLVPDQSMEDRNNGIRGCRITVTLNNGEYIEKTIPVPKGEGKDFLTWEDLRDKLLSCAQGILTKGECMDIIEQCRNIHSNNTYKPIKIRTLE